MRGKAHFQMEDLRSACRVLGFHVSEITKKADQAEEALLEAEDVRVVSQQETKDDKSILPMLLAGCVLAYLLLKVFKSR